MIPELDTLAEARIPVVGDLMLDEYFYGDIERISPEAPVPVVQGRVIRNPISPTVSRCILSTTTGITLTCRCSIKAAIRRPWAMLGQIGSSSGGAGWTG